ncbi:hypothetical protein EV363DRAFT_1189438 [Boletus edulis]|nr:hypothetical protein EV363DRAFT_1189438 [Boletus edulis]
MRRPEPVESRLRTYARLTRSRYIHIQGSLPLSSSDVAHSETDPSILPSLGFYPLHSPWLHLTWARAHSDTKVSYNLKGVSSNVATVQHMPRVHDTLRALMLSTDTMREIFDLR